MMLALIFKYLKLLIASMFCSIMTNSEMLKAHKYIKDFDFEIKRYWDSLQKIDRKVS